jgi:hypothetical protein
MTAAAQATPILAPSDLGPGWSSEGSSTKKLVQGDVYRDLFNAPADYPPGTGVALQVAVTVSDEVRDSLMTQYVEAYGNAGYELKIEGDVGDAGGMVGSLDAPDATSTLYLFTVGRTVVLLVAGTNQPQAAGIDSLALQLAKAQAARLS